MLVSNKFKNSDNSLTKWRSYSVFHKVFTMKGTTRSHYPASFAPESCGPIPVRFETVPNGWAVCGRGRRDPRPRASHWTRRSRISDRPANKWDFFVSFHWPTRSHIGKSTGISNPSRPVRHIWGQGLSRLQYNGFQASTAYPAQLLYLYQHGAYHQHRTGSSNLANFKG